MAKKRRIFDVEDWNKWLTLGANISVVLGLIILISESRQNSTLTRTAAERQLAAWQSDFEFKVPTSNLAELQLKSIYKPEELTREEFRKLDAILVNVQMQIGSLIEMEMARLVTRARVETHILNNSRFYFGSQYAQQWWNTSVVGREGTRLYEAASTIIQSTDDMFLAEYYETLYDVTRSLTPAKDAN